MLEPRLYERVVALSGNATQVCAAAVEPPGRRVCADAGTMLFVSPGWLGRLERQGEHVSVLVGYNPLVGMANAFVSAGRLCCPHWLEGCHDVLLFAM